MKATTAAASPTTSSLQIFIALPMARFGNAFARH
jgi:hypothetical protein